MIVASGMFPDSFFFYFPTMWRLLYGTDPALNSFFVCLKFNIPIPDLAVFQRPQLGQQRKRFFRIGLKNSKQAGRKTAYNISAVLLDIFDSGKSHETPIRQKYVILLYLKSGQAFTRSDSGYLDLIRSQCWKIHAEMDSAEAAAFSRFMNQGTVNYFPVPAVME